jgi:Crp-like helix-turn-helix domain
LTVVQNHLIELLPHKDRQALLKIAETVQLNQSHVLGEPGAPTRYVYFPIDGFISLVTVIDGKPVLEVGMVGREGMWGAHVALGVVTQPLHSLVQGRGSAWRIAIKPFRRELRSLPTLQRVLNRYVYVLMGQMASSAACLRFHEVEPRLARWLLMMEDRAHSNNFAVTHEFLAYMLGVRRVGITTAAGALQKKGLIEYKRGQVTVLDRKGLIAVTCGCYTTDSKAYAALLH